MLAKKTVENSVESSDGGFYMVVPCSEKTAVVAQQTVI